MTGRPPGQETTAGLRGVLATADCRPEHVDEAGGKAVGLGALLRAGLRVPGSFVVGASAYLAYERRVAARHGADADTGPAAIDQELARSIGRAYSALRHGATCDVPVAIRSSATIEDSAEASCAGQYLTFLGARGPEQVLAKIEECWLAASAPHVRSYRSDRGAGTAPHAVAVIVQELVTARASGVIFTQHPRTGDRSVVVIESSYGLGEAVVGGEVAPDLFEVNKITRQISQRRLGSKAAEHRLTADGHGVERLPVDTGRRQAWSITDDEVAALVTTAIELEGMLHRGLDVEWAAGTVASGCGSEALFVLQARPITVGPGPKASAATASAAAAGSSAIDVTLGLLSGRAAEGSAP